LNPSATDPDTVTATMPQAAVPLFRFARLLRHQAFPIAPEQVTTFIKSVGLLGPRSMEDIREAALATLAPTPDRREAFDRLFRLHFFGETPIVEEVEDDEGALARDQGEERNRHTRTLRQEEGGSLSSAAEQLAMRRFDEASPSGDLLQFRRALPSSLPIRRSFRTVGTPSHGQVDLRRALRMIVRADGDVPQLPLRWRQPVMRKVLILIDVSGSMKLYTTDYLRIAHAVVQSVPRAEIFTFGTRLTRITRVLRIRDRERALARAAEKVVDWDGGTRIGPTLLAFLRVPRFAAFARGAVTIILSDALERGDYTEMEAAVRRLSAKSFRLSLCTPLAGDPRFQPKTAALCAIRPVLDDLVDGSSVKRLTDFVLSLGRPPPASTGAIRRQTHSGKR